jgi:hypothetical protein
MRINYKNFFAFFMLALMGLATDSALAQSVGSVADNVVGSGTFGSIMDLFSALCYIIGLIFGIKSALQLKDHTNNPGQHHLSKPIVSMAVCGILLSIPTFLDMLQGTFGVSGTVGGLGTLAGGSPGAATDLSGMFQAFSSNIPSIMKMISFGAVCAGAFMILRAILLLPQLEQGRVEGGKIIWLMFSGIGLWSLLPFIAMSMGTMGMSSTDASTLLTAKYSQVSGGGFDGTIAAVMVFIQLLGLIAFIRGMMILKALGENKDGAMGRALTHIFGGAAAMNVAWTVKLLAVSIGATSVICGISANLCA